MDSQLATFLLLLPSAPLVLVYAIGIIVALLKMGLHRKASAFALAGFVGLLLSTLIRVSGNLMTLPAYRGGLSITELGARLAAINYLATALTVVAMVLLILAIFTGRELPEHTVAHARKFPDDRRGGLTT